MRLLRCALMLRIIRVPAQLVAKIFEKSDRTYEVCANRPKLFSPELLIVPATAHKLSQDSSENADKSTTQRKPCG